uniref:Uncharacterized protein n=1 Tax=Panagrellus redivivus TaxID=6233 RepID=A0A7E4W886_PANRE
MDYIVKTGGRRGQATDRIGPSCIHANLRNIQEKHLRSGPGPEQLRQQAEADFEELCKVKVRRKTFNWRQQGYPFLEAQ